MPDYYRENKPGFFIIAALVLVMLGAMAYFGYSLVRPGGLVIALEKITTEEALDLHTKTTLKVYCREFANECTHRGQHQVERDIKLTLPTILEPVKTPDAKITYRNNTSSPILIQRFLYRTAPGQWGVDDTQTRYAPKIQRLRAAVETAWGNAAFATKLEYARTLALVENNGSFTIAPGEEKTWRLGYNGRSEFQFEYIQNGKLYRTPILRIR